MIRDDSELLYSVSTVLMPVSRRLLPVSPSSHGPHAALLVLVYMLQPVSTQTPSCLHSLYIQWPSHHLLLSNTWCFPGTSQVALIQRAFNQHWIGFSELTVKYI